MNTRRECKRAGGRSALRSRLPGGLVLPARRRIARCGVPLILLLTGCGVDFDPISQVDNLRILGVQKDKPYAAPGDQVALSMLWTPGDDSAPEAEPVEIERAWISGCFNPPGDRYYGCFDQFAESGQGGIPPDPDEIPEIEVGFGDTFELTIPEDIISRRPPPADPEQPPYGLAVVFFAACAGQLGLANIDQAGGLPISCADSSGRALSSDRFVAGYTYVYVYDEFINQNPVITGFELAGESIEPDCIGRECIGIDDSFDPAEKELPILASCESDGEDDCPEIAMKPLIDPTSAEIDAIAQSAYGRTLQEQVWVTYHVTAGSVSSSLRLVNDATAGYNEAYGTDLYAPKQPGLATIWAVVRDNRGGSNWVRVTARVE